MAVIHQVSRAVSGAVALIALVFASNGYSATVYTETIVPDFIPTGISPTGVMVGYIPTASNSYDAGTYANGQVTALDNGGAPYSQARAQNSSGLTVGTIFPSQGPTDAVTWQNGVFNNLGCPNACYYAAAFGVNTAGTIVGVADEDIGAAYPAFRGYVYQNGSFTFLGSLGGQDSGAYGINSSGEIVGQADTAVNYQSHAAIFENGKAIDLDPQQIASSGATAVNDHGTVVGESGQQAVMWDANGKTILDTDYGSGALAINNSGTIVGNVLQPGSIEGSTTAMLWSKGQQYDLNTLVTPNPYLDLMNAVGISESGQIAVVANEGYCPDGDYDAVCTTEGVLLTPISSVPEPATWAMMIIGFGLAGGVMRHRRRTMATLPGD